MENLNWNIAITAVIAVVGFIAPVVTTFLNNIHSEKMKKIELSQQRYREEAVHKRELVEQFLKHLSNNYTGIATLMSTFYLLFPYLTSKEIELIKESIVSSRQQHSESIFEGFLSYENKEKVLKILQRILNEY